MPISQPIVAAAATIATGTIAPMVVSKVRIYAIKTSKSRAEVKSILRALTASHALQDFHSGFGSIVDGEGAPAASNLEDVLSRIGEIGQLTNTRIEGRAGEQTSLFVGQEIPYVKSSEVVGTERRNEVMEVIRAGLTLGVKPAIKSDDSVHVIVAHMITEIENMDGVETRDSVIRLPRTSKTTVLFAASLKTGQSLIYVEFDRPGSPFGAQTILVTMIAPEVAD
jgi:hypothetical protein